MRWVRAVAGIAMGQCCYWGLVWSEKAGGAGGCSVTIRAPSGANKLNLKSNHTRTRYSQNTSHRLANTRFEVMQDRDKKTNKYECAVFGLQICILRGNRSCFVVFRGSWSWRRALGRLWLSTSTSLSRNRRHDLHNFLSSLTLWHTALK